MEYRLFELKLSNEWKVTPYLYESLKKKQFGNVIVAISKLDYFEENLQGRYK